MIWARFCFFGLLVGLGWVGLGFFKQNLSYVCWGFFLLFKGEGVTLSETSTEN